MGIPLGGRGDITAESWDRLRWDRARMVRSRTPFERETEGSRDEGAGDGGSGGEVAYGRKAEIVGWSLFVRGAV